MSRITTSMMSRNVLADLNRTAEKLDHLRAKASSGKELTRPSDNPFATGRALKFRESLEGTRQHQRNANDAIGWQEVTEQALSQITSTGQRLRDLIVQGASDTADPVARNAIAVEVRQLIDGAKQTGNTSYAGRFIFGGTLTTTPPYTLTDDAYHGNDGTIAREIGPGVSLAINQPGSKVLGGAGAGDLIGIMRNVLAHLEANDGAALRGGDLTAIDGKLDSIMAVRAENGANSNRIESALSRLAQFEETTTRQLSETEDADFAKVMIDLSTQQAAYQAALKAGANVVQSSLMDFLR